ncbi:MAG: hypothetical protein CM15mV70_190 [Caudoviricetes sp.]|nr:MAG: hypothetical protein CM15mV70_190 [Caudoviricetes sp.]
MKFDYVAWAKTAQILREHAPGWQFCLDKSTSEEGVSSYVFQAPDGSGFLMGYFEHIDTSVKTTLFPFAITDNANRPLSKISSVNFQNSHRRCLCACGCYSFGDAFELWARVEVKELDQEQQETKEGITRTPDKPNQQPEPVESIENKNYGKPIAQPALEAVVSKIMGLSEKYPKKKDEVLNKYKSKFGITSEKIGPADIRTAEQGQFLTLLINEIDSTL